MDSRYFESFLKDVATVNYWNFLQVGYKFYRPSLDRGPVDHASKHALYDISYTDFIYVDLSCFLSPLIHHPDIRHYKALLQICKYKTITNIRLILKAFRQRQGLESPYFLLILYTFFFISKSFEHFTICSTLSKWIYSCLRWVEIEETILMWPHVRTLLLVVFCLMCVFVM